MTTNEEIKKDRAMSLSTAWIVLFAAGLLEIIWAICIKNSDGLRHLWWTLSGIGLAVVSIAVLAQAMRHLPASTAYAVWAGVGAAGTAIVGMVVLRENASLIKIGSLACIIAGIIGLRLEEGGDSTTAKDTSSASNSQTINSSTHVNTKP